MITRRGLFAALLGLPVAKLAPEPKPEAYINCTFERDVIIRSDRPIIMGANVHGKVFCA